MVRGRKTVKKKEEDLRKKAGFTIIFVSVVFLIVGFVFGMIWSSSIGFKITKHFNEVLTDEEEVISKTEAEDLFDEKYATSLKFLSDGISFDTKWIETCPGTQTKINDGLYIESCDEKFTNTGDVHEYLSKYFTKEFIEKLIGDNYIDYNNKLYVKPYIITKNAEYVGMENFSIRFISNNKVSYSVTSKYGPKDCNDNCSYTYISHLFELEKTSNDWKVSKFELPY